MEVRLSGRVIINRVTAFVERLVDKRHNVVASPQSDPINEEVCRIEQALADMFTRPNRRICKPEHLEPLTEQQKIIDLAG